jgi:hypothetical protein
MRNITRHYHNHAQHIWLGYAGPWLEDLWISQFANRSIDDFGPFVPVFVPWVNIYRAHNVSRSPIGYPTVVRPIFRALRPDFLYVTVNMSDYGLEGMRVPNPDIPPNLLIISASGRGHIPILLHFKPQQPVGPLQRKNTMIFLGKTKRGGRVRIIKTYQHVFGPHLTVAKKVRDWVKAYRQHAVVLSVRGNARGAFRTAEVLQLGLIPVIAFENREWVPYLNSSLPWDDIGFHTVNSEVAALAPKIIALTEERLHFMRQTIRKYRDSHFTIEGTMNQIRLFLKCGYAKSDLRCDTFYPTT